MPYSITTKDGLTLSNIPDDMPPDAPALRQLVMGHRAQKRTASLEFQEKVRAQQAADKEAYDPVKGMGDFEKGRANVGAGLADLWMGAKDLVGAADDEEVLEKRAADKHLADKTTGGAALQFVGNVAPSLALPAGAALRATQTGGRVLKSALSGIQSAAPAAAARPTMAALIGDSAIAGGAGGALQATAGDDSRTLNTLLGAGLGTAVPLLGAGVRQGVRTFTGSGAAARAAEDVQEAVGAQGLPQALAALKGAKGSPLPISTAAHLENPALARMERSSRVDPRSQPEWFDFDKQQAETAWKSVDDATQEGKALKQRQKERGDNWDNNWSAAEGAADPQAWAQRMGDLKTKLDQAARTPEAVNPLVMAALREVDDKVTQFGGEFSPAHLQQLRAQLNGSSSLHPKATSLQSAPRENKAIRSLINELDDILNDTTGGKWDTVKAGYTADTAKVHEAKAAKMVRGAFVDDDTGRVLKSGSPFGADLPEVTAAGVGRAMDAARKPDKSLALSGRANQSLMGLQEALRKQRITQGVARTATAGGGSNTAADLGGAAAQTMAPSLAVQAAGALGTGLKNMGQRKYNEALSDALRNPDAMVGLLSKKLRRDQPLTMGEELLFNALMRTPAGAVGVENSGRQNAPQ
jgi:hypothetical protein